VTVIAPLMAESSGASVASLQEHVPSDDGELERPSFIEVARVTTGEMPSVAPTTLGDPDAGIDRPPASFGSLTREILVIAVCTWAPGGGVWPKGEYSLTHRPLVLGLCWWD